MNTRSLLTSKLFPLTLTALFGGLAFAAPAFAEEDPAQVQDGLEEPGLQEKRPRTEKVEPADPDTALAGKVDLRRKETQDLLNKFQEDVGHKADGLTTADAKAWDKIVAQADKLVQGFLGDQEKFLETHRALLDQFQAATNANKADEAAKLGKQIVKLRADLLVKLDKLTKSAEKVRAEWVKLEERIKKNAEK